MFTTCPVLLTALDLITLTTLGEDYKLENSSWFLLFTGYRLNEHSET
jgi:hypothetical protein